MGLFSRGKDKETLIKQGEDALLNFGVQVEQLNAQKDSMMKRQVEIWSVSTSETNQGMESEYKTAAQGVAVSVKKVLCLEEHIKKIRLGLFHAKNGETEELEKILADEDPCANITPDVPNVIYRPAPSPVELDGNK